MELNVEKRIDKRQYGAFEQIIQATLVVQEKSLISDDFLRGLNIDVTTEELERIRKTQGGLRTIETAMKANPRTEDPLFSEILSIVTASIRTASLHTLAVEHDREVHIYTVYEDGSMSLRFYDVKFTMFFLNGLGLVTTILASGDESLRNELVCLEKHFGSVRKSNLTRGLPTLKSPSL